MKTEILIALIAGTILGLMGMMVVAKVTTTSRPSITLSQSPSPSPALAARVDNKLLSPLPFMSWDDTQIPVKGTAKDGSFVFVVGDTGDMVTSLTDGIFNDTLIGSTGISHYSVFSQNGEKIGETQIARFKGMPTNKQLKFGSVTDLTAESLQIRGELGTIDQLAFSPNIVVASFIKEPKKVDAHDIAIGDKVAIVVDDSSKSESLALGVFIVPSDFSIKKYVLHAGTLSAIEKQSITVHLNESDSKAALTSSTKYFGIKKDGTVRKRTKLIASDTSKAVYFVTEDGQQDIRSIFISE